MHYICRQMAYLRPRDSRPRASYIELWRRLTPLYDEGEAKAIVRTVMDECFGMSLADLLCGGIDRMEEMEYHRLSQMMERLTQAEPVQYVVGKAPFMGRLFDVRQGVLIPRPETEVLCRWIEEEMSHALTEDDRPRQMLDVGCGSGCIALSLALDMPGTRVTACDISPVALEVTRQNAETLGAQVELVCRDALQMESDDLSKAKDHRKWDVVVSNPPYICRQEAADMHPNVRRYEPELALFVPDDAPLLFYRAIARYATGSLRHGGMLFFECNPLYLPAVEEMLRQMSYDDVVSRDDPFGKTRFIKATWL